MRIIPSPYSNKSELPLKLKISFEAVFDYLEKTAKDSLNYLQPTAIKLLEEYKQYPELRNGFEDFTHLDKYNKEIDKLNSEKEYYNSEIEKDKDIKFEKFED